MSDSETSNVPMQPVIQFLLKHHVLLCTACPKSTCIPPNGLTVHLRKHHKDQFTCEQRKKLTDEARKHPSLAPQNVLIPRREDGPVPGLHIHAGWECT
jgi:Orsellinic acid/F9775 biosynthesis cluster protein D